MIRIYQWVRLLLALFFRPGRYASSYTVPNRSAGAGGYLRLLLKFAIATTITALPVVVRIYGWKVVQLSQLDAFLSATIRVSWTIMIITFAAIGFYYSITRILANSVTFRKAASLVTLGSGVYLSLLFVITTYCGATCAYFGQGTAFILSRLYGPVDILLFSLFLVSILHFYLGMYGGIAQSENIGGLKAHFIALTTTVLTIILVQVANGTIRDAPRWLRVIFYPVF